jgi:hypothetical protein
MDVAATEELRRAAPRRRCRRCGAYLSTSNTEPLCFPCQRTEFEALWMSGTRRRGRVVPSRVHAAMEGS